MSAGAIEAGRAFVRLLLNDKELSKGLTKAQNRLKVFAASTGRLGRQMLSLSAAIAAPMAAGAKAFADFEMEMAQTATLVDDENLMPGFTEGIKTLAIEFGESKDALAAGLRDILGAAIEPAKAMDVLTVSVRAAKAALTDTATATDAITTLLNAYQIDASRAGEVSDWLFRVADRGKSTFPELAHAIGNVATTAATANIDLDELGAMLAILTRAGIKTDTAVTSLNAIISSFIKPADEAKEIAAKFGINLSSATLKADGLVGTIKKLTDLPPDVLAKIFPERRALMGILPALRNLEGIEEDLRLIASSTGATEEAYAKLANTMTTKFEQVRETIAQAAGAIGEALIEDLKEGADKIKEIGEYVVAWISDHRELIQVLGKSAFVIAAVAGALIGLQTAAKVAAVAIGGLKLAIHGVTVAATFLAAHPVVAVLAGIAVAVGAAGYAMDKAASDTLRLADAQTMLLEKGDQKRKQDMNLLNRLKVLSREEQLSNERMNEAASIIERLQSVYGDLGLSIDRTTGKITGVADAYDQLTQAMQRNLAVELKAALQESRANMQMLANELQQTHEAFMTPWGRSQRELELSVQANREKARHDALMSRYRQALGGTAEPDVTTAGGDPEAMAADILEQMEAQEKAAKEAAEFQADLDARMHQVRLDMIEDEYKRDLEAIKAKHLAELREAKKAGRDVAALREVQSAEVGVIDAEHRRKQKDEEERRTQNQKDLQEEIEDLTIRTQYEGLDQQLQLIEVQRKRAIAEAKTLGLSVDDVNKKFDLMADLARKDVVPEVEQKTSVAGTFSAQMAARMGGSVEEKQLKAQQEIVTHTKRTAEAVSALGRLSS